MLIIKCEDVCVCVCLNIYKYLFVSSNVFIRRTEIINDVSICIERGGGGVVKSFYLCQKFLNDFKNKFVFFPSNIYKLVVKLAV